MSYIVATAAQVQVDGNENKLMDLIEEFNLKIQSDLDSEVIPQLINFFLENNNFSISLKLTIEHLGGEVSI